MLTYRQALAEIRANVQALEPVERPLADSGGFVAAGSVSSPIDLPAFANSAMDGFALSAADADKASQSSPVALPIAGVLQAGSPPVAGVAGAAMEITTGAALPGQYDTVIPIERAIFDRDSTGQASRLRLEDQVARDKNVRHVGEDIRRGDELIAAGQYIGPPQIMGLAATGIDRVQVRPKPVSTLLTTGTEILTAGAAPAPGRIFDANGPYVSSFFAAIDMPLARAGNADDDIDTLCHSISMAADTSDIVITTGGVSAGQFDLVPDALAKLGAEIIFHKVAIRPGKPILFAKLGKNKLFFGLPGNPIAVAVGLRFFVTAAMRQLQGMAAESFTPAELANPVRKREQLYFFGKALASSNNHGQIQVELLKNQESFKIGSLMQANCWSIIPDGTEQVAAGTMVEVASLLPAGSIPG